MNEEQAKSLIRTLGATFGGGIMGWFASKGWHLSPDEVKSLTTLFSSPELIGLLASALVAIAGLFTHKQSNAVAVVAEMAHDPSSPVKGVIVEPTREGRALVAAAKEVEPLVGTASVVLGGSAAASTMATG